MPKKNLCQDFKKVKFLFWQLHAVCYFLTEQFLMILIQNAYPSNPIHFRRNDKWLPNWGNWQKSDIWHRTQWSQYTSHNLSIYLSSSHGSSNDFCEEKCYYGQFLPFETSGARQFKDFPAKDCIIKTCSNSFHQIHLEMILPLVVSW